ncbi:MAG: FlgD immunoglobulin-like domain containing protein, partial [candidate division WOR-3 bacterium]
EGENQKDPLGIVAADNYLNRFLGIYYLHTDPRGDLRIEDCLVYPNPVADRAWFTFNLTGSALVTVKVFTIAGRLVRILGPQVCGFGYNQIEWDGKDKDGNPLANGVYLYKIDAGAIESSGGAVQSRSASYRDRFIIRH